MQSRSSPYPGFAPALLDHRICDSRYPFAYTLYTKEQNALMHQYQGLFRFMADTPEDLAHACNTLDRLLNKAFAEDTIQTKGRHRHWHDIHRKFHR